MVAYVSLPQKVTKRALKNGRSQDVTGGGAVRGQSREAESAFRLTVRHTDVTLTQRDSVMSHYGTNRNNLIQITHGGDTYDGIYLGEPDDQLVDNSTAVWIVTSTFIANRQ